MSSCQLAPGTEVRQGESWKGWGGLREARRARGVDRALGVFQADELGNSLLAVGGTSVNSPRRSGELKGVWPERGRGAAQEEAAQVAEACR